jgi:hypothetical protein
MEGEGEGGESGDETELGDPESVEDVVEQLKTIIAEELEMIPRGPKAVKLNPEVTFKTAIFSKILEVEMPNSNQSLYTMIW